MGAEVIRGLFYSSLGNVSACHTEARFTRTVTEILEWILDTTMNSPLDINHLSVFCLVTSQSSV